MKPGEKLFQGYRFYVQRVTQTGNNGQEHDRDIIRHPGAVVVLPLLDDGRICMIRNYRVAVDETLIELPAGTAEPNEDPAVTAERELAEETGYRAEKIEPLLDFYTSPGFLDEKMYLFLATGLQPGDMSLDPGEEIETLLCTLDEAIQMVRENRIRDAKTVAGLLYYAAFCREA